MLALKTEQDYQDALEAIECLISKAKDTLNDPLNDLIDIISSAKFHFVELRPKNQNGYHPAFQYQCLIFPLLLQCIFLMKIVLYPDHFFPFLQ